MPADAQVPPEPEVPAWWIYRGRPGGPAEFPKPPPWRSFTGVPPRDAGDPRAAVRDDSLGATVDRRLGRHRQAATYQADDKEINLVNLALYLRRPLLVTGLPGVGKSTLAYSVAHELNLGPVLSWPITSRSQLQDGLYQYDAVGRLQAVSLHREVTRAGTARAARERAVRTRTAEPDHIGAYLRLGPLGTALLPRTRPRVLLIDEIDKSDIDLPNDLLNVFEDGEFVIPELARMSQPKVDVLTADDGAPVTVENGLVRCREFPFIVMTSNEERDFPKAFLRRCIRLEIQPPNAEKLARMVDAHLEDAESPPARVRQEIIAEFLRKQQQGAAILANDQLLNALRMAAAGLWADDTGRDLIDGTLLRSLDEL